MSPAVPSSQQPQAPGPKLPYSASTPALAQACMNSAGSSPSLTMLSIRSRSHTVNVLRRPILLASISGVLEDEAVLEQMKATDDVDWIVQVLSEGR